MTVGEGPDALTVLINPEVKETEGCEVGEEGCLSFPGINVDVARATHAVVEALDLDGTSRVLECEGLMARVVLHECEHLDGHVFLRNLSPLKRELIKKQIRKRIKAGDWVEAEAP